MSLHTPDDRSDPLKREPVEAPLQQPKDSSATREFLRKASLIANDGQLAAPDQQSDPEVRRARIRAQSRAVARHIQHDPTAQAFINDWATSSS